MFERVEGTYFYGGHGVEEAEGIIVQQLPMGQCSTDIPQKRRCIQPYRLATAQRAAERLTRSPFH